MAYPHWAYAYWAIYMNLAQYLSTFIFPFLQEIKINHQLTHVTYIHILSLEEQLKGIPINMLKVPSGTHSLLPPYSNINQHTNRKCGSILSRYPKNVELYFFISFNYLSAIKMSGVPLKDGRFNFMKSVKYLDLYEQCLGVVMQYTIGLPS